MRDKKGMIKFFKKMAILSVTVLIAVTLMLPVFATETKTKHYDLACKRLEDRTPDYRWGGNIEGATSTSREIYKTIWRRATGDWGGASITFTYNSSSENSLDVMYEASSSGYGESHSPPVNGIITYFYAKVNVAEIESYSDNFFRSTANHELGHIMGLKHYYGESVIMNTGRNRNSLYIPTSYDCDGVNEAFDAYPDYTGWLCYGK